MPDNDKWEQHEAGRTGKHRPRSRSPHAREHGRSRHNFREDHPNRGLVTKKGRSEDDGLSFRWGKEADASGEEGKEIEKEPEPEFGLSGALAAETNTQNGVVLLHNEPPEARIPESRWRLYVFKGGELQGGEPLFVSRQSRYLFGRERRVADIPTDHPSCSKQHAVLQYRLTEKKDPDGLGVSTAVRPYIMDLGSTNGTFLNEERLEAQRYYELLEKDMIRFGNSSREYILLKEK
jgi:smad nuclear-interacting protein 1